MIVGAGQAGAVAARCLRDVGFDGEIVMIGAELDPPYERPELSKAYLGGSASFEKLRVLSPEQIAALGLTFRADETVSGIDTAGRTLVTSIGAGLSYDHLILATGGAPRPLDGSLTLRTRTDADEIRARLGTARSLGIVGAGWLGLELAAHARSQGCAVTVYERGETVCGRVLPRDVSDHLARHHRDAGTELALGHAPDLARLRASYDPLVACIGMTPHDALARAAGIDTDAGLLVDARQATSAEDIFAIGDCARPRDGHRMESWAYANLSAKRAAAAIAGVDAGPDEPLWFWSKQGDLMLQMIGSCADTAEVVAEPSGQAGHVWQYTEAGALCGLVAINAPRAFAKARRALSQGAA